MSDIPSENLSDLALPDAAVERRREPRQAFRKVRRDSERVQLLGQTVDLMRPEEVLHHVETWVEAGHKALIANHNLNSLALLQREPRLQQFYDRADLVEVDSTPLIHFAKLLGLQSRPFHRCTYLDWRDHFWSLADRKAWRVLYLGGERSVVERARDRLKAQYPGAEIQVRDGFFDATAGSNDNARVLAEIAHFKPHILFVGMGMPRQELWIVDHLDILPPCAVFSVGAAFDYEAGAQKAAPRWMGRLGIEWAFRLVHDPRRLARRYLIEPWSLSRLILADLSTAVRKRKIAPLSPAATRT